LPLVKIPFFLFPEITLSFNPFLSEEWDETAKLAPKTLKLCNENRVIETLTITPSRYKGNIPKDSALLKYFEAVAATLQPGQDCQFRRPNGSHSHYLTFEKPANQRGQLIIRYEDNERTITKTDIDQTIHLNLATGHYIREGYFVFEGQL